MVALLLPAVLFSAKKVSTGWLLMTRPFLSALFVLTALVGPHGNPLFFRLVLAGSCRDHLDDALIPRVFNALHSKTRLLDHLQRQMVFDIQSGESNGEEVEKSYQRPCPPPAVAEVFRKKDLPARTTRPNSPRP